MLKYDNHMKKHGIHIQVGKKTQTKKIYNNGYLMVRYFFQPHHLDFKSDMINDMNQHFCGGWTMSGIDSSKSALLKRVLNKEKPLAIIFESEKEDLEKYLPNIDSEKFYFKVFRNPTTMSPHIAVSQKGKMKDLFDLATLKKDYEDNGISIDVKKVENKTLEEYFDDWDAQDSYSKIEYWETGLILGYPIENTISLYRGGIK